MRVTPLEFVVALGAGHKESLGFVNDEQSCEIQIAPVHQAEGPRLQSQIVHDVALVGLAVGEVNEAVNIAFQIEQGVQLDGYLGGSKRCPCKHRQTQVNGAGIEGIDCRVEFDAKRLLGM